ncbi:hypothetical protein [Chitinophaga solisilvae]|uniref:hypothetical protein n=1 Tax=Chitinophaga solisilvae TaxID=1233460 RepID=UPI00136EB4E9|nr:hypothetical protein [Chitinophaga solisilvae]
MSFAMAQGTVTSHRLIIRDSLQLGNRWIRGVNNDGRLLQANGNTVSTDAVLKQYVDKVSGRNIPGIHVLCRFENASPGYRDSIKFEIVSSEGIVTPAKIYQQSADKIFAEGKPPFKIRGQYINNKPGTVLGYRINSIYEQNFDVIYNQFSRQAYLHDTLQLLTESILGNMNMFFKVADSLSSMNDADTLVGLHITLKNITEESILEILGNRVPAQTTCSYFMRFPMSKIGYTNFGPFDRWNMTKMKNGGITGMESRIGTLLRTYKNGEPHPYPYGSGRRVWPPDLSVDPSWKDLYIELDYMPEEEESKPAE